MCGITGIIDLSGAPVGRFIAPMLASLDHRGPDDEGYLLAGTNSGRTVLCRGDDTIPDLIHPHLSEHEGGHYNLAFGHRRLSILDLSAAGHGPMASADQQLWITYNGEIYNYIELREELAAKGYQFRTETDTEVILAAYEEWGTDCLNHFNGMWAFAIWDQRRRRLFCARDRFGIKPFHYFWDGRLFAFASEIRALLRCAPVPATPNDQTVYDFLALGANDHQEQTFFAGILRLLPAHFLIVDLESGNLTKERYWDLPSDSDHGFLGERSQSDVIEQFQHLLFDAIRLRLRSDVAVGSCLSGGLDSSTIVSQVHRLLLAEELPDARVIGARQKTFSACYDDLSVDERNYIRLVTDRTDTESKLVFPKGSGGLWQELNDLIYHQGEPFGSTSIYAQWNVMRLASQNDVTVLLDGQGADELMAGYHSYYGPYLAESIRRGKILSFARGINAVSEVSGQSKLFLAALGLYNALPDGPQQLARSITGSRFQKFSTVGREMLNDPFARRHTDREHLFSKFRGYGSVASRSYHDIFSFSLPALLRYEDRNSMAFSMEARVPFLDYRLVEFISNLPVSYRIRDGWTKWILRQSTADLLPEEVRWRRDKLGFATPEAAWLAEGTAEIRALFSSSNVRSQEYLGQNLLRQLTRNTDEDLTGLPGLWRMVVLELWLQTCFS
ncbi:MAG TPA: asparagine synthase (glutamine-hydrolyzing) [candidate division Zixibacteria bacterium]|nr:asparagine synthase (glutamine-hydrolyzing) [candidate division Zixibacteria bacterium]